MKKTYFITTAVALMLAVMPALAQTTSGGATGATTSNTVGTTSGSLNRVTTDYPLGTRPPAGLSGSGSGTFTTGTPATGTTGTATTDPLNPATRAAPGTPSTMDLNGFNALTRSRWDTNSDGRISAAEWNSSHPRWFGSTTRETPRNFTMWDYDHDGFLDDNELKQVFGTSGIHSLYDLNGNGVIESNEAARIPR